MSDGLSQLAQRGRRTREIPPTRNPARSEPVHLTSVPDEKAVGGTPTTAAPAVTPVPVRSPRVRATAVGSAQAASDAQPILEPAPGLAQQPAAKPALKVVTVYLEQDDDDFLETITHTGRTSQPKTAISRSAVVRLALERLHTQLTPNRSSTSSAPAATNPAPEPAANAADRARPNRQPAS